MCTRFFIEHLNPELMPILQTAKQSRLLNTFFDNDAAPLITSGEVRPTNLAAVLAPDRTGRRAVYPMKWGYKLNDRTILFNARSETASEKPTFREDWQKHRCIIPCSWYFEWEHRKNARGETTTGDKYAIQPAGRTVTWLCGLYRIENGLPYFVILTREPDPELRKIHDRMPLILPENKIDEWIRPDADPQMLCRYALKSMIAEKVD